MHIDEANDGGQREANSAVAASTGWYASTFLYLTLNGRSWCFLLTWVISLCFSGLLCRSVSNLKKNKKTMSYPRFKKNKHFWDLLYCGQMPICILFTLDLFQRSLSPLITHSELYLCGREDPIYHSDKNKLLYIICCASAPRVEGAEVWSSTPRYNSKKPGYFLDRPLV